jgi:hypothetical protein
MNIRDQAHQEWYKPLIPAYFDLESRSPGDWLGLHDGFWLFWLKFALFAALFAWQDLEILRWTRSGDGPQRPQRPQRHRQQMHWIGADWRWNMAKHGESWWAGDKQWIGETDLLPATRGWVRSKLKWGGLRRVEIAKSGKVATVKKFFSRTVSKDHALSLLWTIGQQKCPPWFLSV